MTIPFLPCYKGNGNRKIKYNLSGISASYWQAPPTD